MSAATDVQKRQIQAFIEVDPSDLVLRRPVLVADGAGGKVKDDDSDTYPQHCRIIGVRDPFIVVTDDGRQVTVTTQLVGLKGFDVQIGDHVDIDGVDYEIASVSSQPRWRTIAGATRIG